MSKLATTLGPVAALCALTALSGCARQTTLHPVSAANANTPNIAVARGQDLKLTAQVDAWKGESGVRDHVTPVLVTIENDSDEPIRLRYDHIALVAPDGRRFEALPPFRIEGSVTRTAQVTGYPPFAPDFYHDGFWVDPAYGAAYPTIAPYSSAPYYDFDYYRTHYVTWKEPLPTPTMMSMAIPEGVIEPGGTVSGFLYFQRVKDTDQVSLQAALPSARERGRVVGRLTIPFDVGRG